MLVRWASRVARERAPTYRHGARCGRQRRSTSAQGSSSISIRTLWRCWAGSIWFSMSSAATSRSGSAGVIRAGGTLVTSPARRGAALSGGRRRLRRRTGLRPIGELVQRLGMVGCGQICGRGLDDAVAAFNRTDGLRDRRSSCCREDLGIAQRPRRILSIPSRMCLSIDVLKHRASVGPDKPKDALTSSISPWPTVFCGCNFVLFETF